MKSFLFFSLWLKERPKYPITPLVSRRLDFAAVLQRAVEGREEVREEAMTHLWKTQQPVLFGWLYAMTGSRSVADDVSSEAWLAALKELRRFQGDEHAFRSWLFTIARRRFIDQHRKTQYLHMHAPLQDVDGDSDVMGIEEIPSNDGTFSDPEATAMTSVATQDAIDLIHNSLSPDQAEVLLLRVVGGLDTQQTADVTGKTTGAVRVLQHRALANLEAQLSHAHIGEEEIAMGRAATARAAHDAQHEESPYEAAIEPEDLFTQFSDEYLAKP